MRIEEHRAALAEHVRHINRAIDEGIENNQRNVGYNASQGAVELFAIYLHTLHIIEGSGDQWDHRIFKNKSKVEQKVPLTFAHRTEILKFMELIELERNILCYGKRKPVEQVEKILNAFLGLRRLIGDEK